jgi:hypothetical protein
MLRLCGAPIICPELGPTLPAQTLSLERMDSIRTTELADRLPSVVKCTLLREFIVLLDPDNSGISKGRVRGEQPTSQWRHYHAVP